MHCPFKNLEIKLSHLTTTERIYVEKWKLLRESQQNVQSMYAIILVLEKQAHSNNISTGSPNKTGGKKFSTP